MTERFNLDRIARPIGSQPSFHADPTVEALTAMVIALVGEVAVLRDRLDAAERLSREPQGFGPPEVDGFQPDARAIAERQAVRDAMYDRVLGAGVEKLVPERLAREHLAYDQILRDVGAR